MLARSAAKESFKGTSNLVVFPSRERSDNFFASLEVALITSLIASAWIKSILPFI